MGVDNGESSGMEVVGGTEDHGNSAENGKESTRWRPVFVFDIDEGNGSAAGSNGNAAVLSTKMGQLRVVDADDLDLPATSTQNGAPDADGSMEAHAGLETRAAQTPDIDEILAERLRQGAKRYFPQLAATLPAELNAMLDDSASEAGSSEGGSEDWMLSDDDGDAETDLRETHAQVSFFGQLHMHMDAWVTGETLDLLHSGPEAPAPSGRMSGTVPEIHTALGRFVSTALPPVMDGLKVGVPRGEVEKGLGDVLRTLRLTGALPAFSSMQWQVLVVVLLKALSMERLPSLRPSFETREGIQRLGQTLAASSFTIEELYAVLELLLDPDA